MLRQNRPILLALVASAALHAAGAAAALLWPWALPRGRQDQVEITWLAGPGEPQESEGEGAVERPLVGKKSGAAAKGGVAPPATPEASPVRTRRQDRPPPAKVSLASAPKREEKGASPEIRADAAGERGTPGRSSPAQAAAAETPRTAAVEAAYVGAKAQEKFSSATFGDVRPLCLSCPVPRYPLRARREGWQGEVDVGVEIAVDGRVAQATVMRSCGHAVLDKAALEVARRSRFSAPSSGQLYRGSIKYRFVLGEP